MSARNRSSGSQSTQKRTRKTCWRKSLPRHCARRRTRRKANHCGTSIWTEARFSGSFNHRAVEIQEGSMGVVSIPKRKSGVAANPKASNAEPVDWVNLAAGSALLVGGLLFLTEKRRAGIAVAAAGTALALLDQQEAVRTWWNRIPEIGRASC